MKASLKLTWAIAILSSAATSFAGTINPTTYEIQGATAIYSVSFDSSGNLWATGVFGGHSAVAQINPGNGAVMNTYTTSGLNLYQAQTAIDASGNLYIPTNYGGNKLWQFNTSTDAFSSYSSVGGVGVYSGGISIDSNGEFWMGNNADVLSFSSPSGSATVYGFSNDANTLGRGPITAAISTGSDVIYSIYAGGNHDIGIMDTSTLSSNSNIEYSPLESIAGGGTRSDPAYPVMDSHGNIYTIDQTSVHSMATLYRLDLTTDLWNPVEQLGGTVGSGYTPLVGAYFTIDNSGNVWAASTDLNGPTLVEYGAATPEPGTWVLLLTGLAGVAGGARRRARRVSQV